MTVRTMTGKIRAEPRRGQADHPHEIEPGRPVVNDWDKHLFETWSERKARLARERSAR